MLEVLLQWARRLWQSVQAGWGWVCDLVGQIGVCIRTSLSWGQAAKEVSTEPASAPVPPQPSAPIAAPAVSQAALSPETQEDPSDETALARMLASQERPADAKLVTAWLTIQKQRARKQSLFQMLTNGKGYGPQDRKAQNLGVMYASTATPPSPTDRLLARGILSGAILPSETIRAHKPGELVERGKGITDGKLLQRQVDLSQGIYGQIAGTRWFLFSPDAPQIVLKPGQNTAAALDAVPEVMAVDSQSLNLTEKNLAFLSMVQL